MKEIRRGDIYFVSPKINNEEIKTRPAVIVSNNTGNEHSGNVIVAYLTSQEKKNYPMHVIIESTGKESVVLCEHIETISKERLESYMCMATEEEMMAIDNALMLSFGIQNNCRNDRLETIIAERNAYKKIIMEMIRK